MLSPGVICTSGGGALVKALVALSDFSILEDVVFLLLRWGE